MGSEFASREPRKGVTLANEITQSLCGVKRILGDELFSGANDEQIQKVGKRQCLWFVDGHLIEFDVLC